MPKTIISDTSCLILLDKIGEIGILKKLFGQAVITDIIAQEFGKPLPDWILIKNAQNLTYQNILSASVDKGEASALALAVEIPDCLLILDDYKARKLAASLTLKFTGTIGILIEAKQSGIVPAIKPILAKIKQTNFRISPELEARILTLTGE